MSDSDCVRRFGVEHQSVRGQFVRLGPAWLALREHASYPAPVRTLLGEAVAAAVLLASTLKFEGELTLQLQGDGAVRLLVAQCTHDFRVRGVARFDPARVADDFRVLAGAGQIAVTVEAERRSARYQGIVPIDGAGLAACLEHYFAQSEQLPTVVRLAAEDSTAGGLLVQRMPGGGGHGADDARAEAARAAEAQRIFSAAGEALAGIGGDELLLRPPPTSCSAASPARTCGCTVRRRCASSAAAAVHASPACCARSASPRSATCSPSRAR
ncbi:MAG: Hsp33 family molecular chaperone HslO [Steroidobacteraceae bacterium]